MIQRDALCTHICPFVSFLTYHKAKPLVNEVNTSILIFVLYFRILHAFADSFSQLPPTALYQLW